MINNLEISTLFNKLADLLEIEGANPFRIRAYRNAARVIAGLSKNLSDLIAENYDLTDIPGIGNDLADKIKVIVKTGKFPALKEIESRVPSVLTKLLQIEGLGPIRVRQLYKKLHIRNINDLKRAIKSGKVENLAGFGEKSVNNIRRGLQHAALYSKRFKLADATVIAEHLTNYLKKSPVIKKVECAGSYRRKKETVGDLDFVACSNDSKKAIEHFISFEEVEKVISQGKTRSTVRLHSGIQVDFRVVGENSYGATLLYFTGSKSHNIALRKLALHKNYKLNEYGLFQGDKQIAGKTEKGIYNKIGLKYIEPEMREDNGEIELAQKNISQGSR